jgi:hypothetical protein
MFKPDRAPVPDNRRISDEKTAVWRSPGQALSTGNAIGGLLRRTTHASVEIGAGLV